MLVPLEIEKAALADVFRLSSDCLAIRKGKIEVLDFPALGLRLATAGHGKSQFALQTQFLLHHLPETMAVVCGGCAGALSEKVRALDLVIGEKSVEHDFKLGFVKKPLPEFKADTALLTAFRNLDFDSCQVHFGPIASGDEDVMDRVRAREISLATNALAVAWEGAGGARACRFNAIPFIEIR